MFEAIPQAKRVNIHAFLYLLCLWFSRAWYHTLILMAVKDEEASWVCSNPCCSYVAYNMSTSTIECIFVPYILTRTEQWWWLFAVWYKYTSPRKSFLHFLIFYLVRGGCSRLKTWAVAARHTCKHILIFSATYWGIRLLLIMVIWRDPQLCHHLICLWVVQKREVSGFSHCGQMLNVP